jgi:protein disulfide-isomerase
VAWLQEYNLARIKGIEESRPVLLFVTTDNCIYCTRMYNQAFQDQTVIHQLQEKFVPAQLKLDPHSDLAQQLRITIYPTTVIIDTDGTILDYARGFLSTDDLRTRMSRITDAVDHIAALPDSKSK